MIGAGTTIAGRYRLEAELGRGRASVVFRAFDERLERPVAVCLFDESIDHGVLHERAGRAASLTHPRVTRIFDTGRSDGRFYCVRELLPAALTWAGLPMSPMDGVQLGAEIAEALHYAHERGVAHGCLHAGNVLLSEQGAKVSDFGLCGGALKGLGPLGPAEDLRELGNLLYRVLTGRDHGTTGARGRLLPSEPRGLASVVGRLREGAYTDASQAASDLRALAPEPERTRPKPVLAVAAAVALAVLVAFGATQLGDRQESRSPARDGGAVSGTAYPVRSVQDFDPLGDGREGRSTVARIVDGDPRTFWSTERYQGGATFAGLKQGVGVILEMGEERLAGKSAIVFAAAGCGYELRFSTTRDPDVAKWPVVYAEASADLRSVAKFPATASRWWLIWITRLTQSVPGAEQSFACGVSEAQLYEP